MKLSVHTLDFTRVTQHRLTNSVARSLSNQRETRPNLGRLILYKRNSHLNERSNYIVKLLDFNGPFLEGLVKNGATTSEELIRTGRGRE